MGNTPFRVVRGKENAILNMPFVEGYVYFATDTKRIYMDAYLNNEEQNKLSMGGGNSGIYYASKNFTDSSDTSFALIDIEGNELPNKNDLIINYNSGNELRDGFYKVISTNIETNIVETQYLPVGGGGTGGSSSSSGGKILITPITPATGITTSEKGYKIQYSLEVYNNAQAPVLTSGRATFIINGVSIDGGYVSHGNSYEFDVSQYLSTIKDTNTITLKIAVNTGGVVDDIQTYTWTVKCVDLKLIWNWNYSSENYIKENNFSLSWQKNGGIDCVTHIMVDDKTDEDHYFKINLSAAQSEASKTFTSFSYGAHKFTMWLTAKVGSEDITSNSINHILTFINGEETGPILTVPYFEEKVTQYDTLRIPFLLYKPNTEKLKVSFYVDDVEVLTDEYETTAKTPHYWPYTIGRAGEVKLKIAFTAYPENYYTITLQVAPLDLGIEEPDGLEFSLKASDISGNAQLKQLEEKGDITFSENFDWINGGIQSEQDENGNISNYICVRQGTTMTINYELFKSSSVGNSGKTFKFCFKAVNCYNYDALVLKCYEDNTKLGLKFNAQSALFSSAANNNFTTQYCEGSYIELETEIWPDQADNGYRPGDRFLMFWVDGIPAGVQVFDSGTTFQQNKSESITIGSNECDVYVYLVKIYERKLSALEHLNNFILDAPNVNEKKARFVRNDILGNNSSEISYEKLVTNNPGCHAYLYQLTENGMTTGKEDEKDCNYTEYYMNSEKPYIKADNAKVFVQGTSSAAYGVAAFNVRTDFGDTIMYDGDGKKLEGRKVSETSIPIDYTCTKVNVASCENANNALNSEWYNRFQPYYDGHRRKSTKEQQYRDCMEFDFGVMFIEDHNKNSNYKNTDGKPDKSLYTSVNVFAYNTNGDEDRNYINSPYYKQYAVANMGNDKKNLEVFHDVQNPKACCVEILDNQNAEHWMTKTVTIDDFVWDDNDDGFYEFRYSVKKCKAADKQGITEQKQAEAFIDFVNWMASCDPNPKSDSHPNGYTGEEFSVPITYGEKVFTGFIPEGWSDDTSSGVSLRDFSTNKYSGTYTHDTKEYRIAKMLNECEDHLVMDSVVYHYLFIQRHTMVDNVAKNTFWSTEDLQHWDLTKNYDNDTSDGNDNSGYLKYTYGKEIMDVREDGADVFNASDSVWLNFIYNLPDVQEDLYKKLLNRKINGVHVWDINGYLKLFKEKQSLIPERCWIEDYFRKYIRPRRLGLDGDNTFIQRLEGGKKTHQRQQYETYQGYYIDSKYCAGNSFNDTGSFDMRLNKASNTTYALTTDETVIEGTDYFELKEFTDSTGTLVEDYVKVEITDTSINPKEEGYFIITSGGWNNKIKFPIQYYIDLYPSAKIGGQIWRGGRTKRSDTNIVIPIGELLDAPTDATCYIYAANMIQSIKGIADTYPNYMGVSAASKLRELEAGSSVEGYFNNKLNNAKLDQNTQLEKAQLQQVGSEKLSGLDLSRLTMLKELKINKGSTFPSLKLAKGCIINTLYLNPLQDLRVKELKSLIDFQYDEEIFDTLTTILIQDCPTLNSFGYELVKNNKITNYCFNNIDWEVPSEDININNGTINILENLLEKDDEGNKLKGFVEVASQALALTGKLTINLSDGIDKTLNEYEIYVNYKKEFPNLNIEYTGNINALQPAKNIVFYNDYNEETGKYGDIIYQVKTDGTKNLGYLISADGPTGTAITVPTKDSDKVYDYEWSGKWKSNKIIDGRIEHTDDQMNALIPTEDLILYPIYMVKKHLYTIVLRDYDGFNIEHDIEPQEYEADITSLMPFYRYRPHTTDEMRYEFQGWISAKDYLSGKSDVTPITNFIVEGDTTYYAYYIEQNCLTTSSKMDYFTFSNNTISLKEKYRDLIQEPITLPYVDINGNSLTTIGNFSGENVKITHIYFLQNGNSNYTTIANSAFINSGIISIDLPSSITIIGSNAFQNCNQLQNLGNYQNIETIGGAAFQRCINLNLDLDTMNNLKTIEGSAFAHTDGINANNIIATVLPKQLTVLSQFAFMWCPNVNFSNFTQLTNIEATCLEHCGNGVETITIDANTSIAKNAFNLYAPKATNLVVYGNIEDSDLSEIGLDRDWTNKDTGLIKGVM